MNRYIALILAVSMLAVSCGGEPTPAPDLVVTHVAAMRAAAATLTVEAPEVDPVGTQLAAMRAAAATLTAEAPTVTNTPPDTATPILTPMATNTATPMPTNTPATALTPSPLPPVAPTEAPEPAPKAKPTKKPQAKPTEAPKRPLDVTYQDLLYQCAKTQWYLQPTDEYIWGYRSFQAMMVIKNNSPDRTVEPPWKPDRWIAANWRNPEEERILDYAWQWGPKGRGAYEQPVIPPGGTGRWTWLAFPLDRWEYMKAAEFDGWGETYRFEFPRPEYAGPYNFKDCGLYPADNKPSDVAPAYFENPTP